MYEKQVMKDGIRRTVMTKSGCATERHFSVKDLRRLFELMPVGVCEMLDKVQSNVKSDAKGSSGKRSVLEAHEMVVGVTSHDLVYNTSVIDISEGENHHSKTMESPFAGTTGKKVWSRRISSDARNDALPGFSGNRNNNPKPPSAFKNTKLVNEKGSFQTKEVRETSNGSESDMNSKNGNFLDVMKNVDYLTKNNKMEESLLILFNLLMNPSLLKSEKMMIHQKIASRVSYLGWI